MRQLSLLSIEELAEIADAMGIPKVKPEWVGANLVTVRHSRSHTCCRRRRACSFPSGATLVVDLENAPCRFVADVIAKHHPEAAVALDQGAATHKRGVTAWVEREGGVAAGDAITRLPAAAAALRAWLRTRSPAASSPAGAAGAWAMTSAWRDSATGR